MHGVDSQGSKRRRAVRKGAERYLLWLKSKCVTDLWTANARTRGKTPPDSSKTVDSRRSVREEHCATTALGCEPRREISAGSRSERGCGGAGRSVEPARARALRPLPRCGRCSCPDASAPRSVRWRCSTKEITESHSEHNQSTTSTFEHNQNTTWSEHNQNTTWNCVGGNW